MTRLLFDPWIPLGLWMPLALTAAALWCAYVVTSRQRIDGRQRRWILPLMAIALLIPLVILLNPTWIREIPPPAGKPLLTLLIDRSGSMAVADGVEQQSRLNRALQIAQAVTSDLSTRFDVELKTFNASVTSASLETLRDVSPAGDVSDLATAVGSSLADRPRGQLIWLLSDGVHNAPQGVARLRQAAEQARTMAVPVYTTTIGAPTGVDDLEVSLPLPQEMAFVGQSVMVPVTVLQRGQVNDRAIVRLLLDGEMIEERQVGLTRDTPSETTFQIQQPATGLFRYEVVVAPAPNEVTDLNNRASFVLRVIDEPVRVLLLEGKPYWDTKFLVRTLALDPSIELHTVVRMAPDRYLARTMVRPGSTSASTTATDSAENSTQTTATSSPGESTVTPRDDAWEILHGEQHWLDDPQQLAKFQIVILGRNAESFINDSALSELKKWLRQGDGSLVCFRGPPTSQISERLGEMLPLRWTRQNESRFRVQFTTNGRSLHWFSESDSDATITQLPSLARTAEPEPPKPLAVVLAAATPMGAGDQSPAITFQPYGGGRVVVVEGAGMWRWAILPPGAPEQDQLYGELWRSMMRWLVANVGLLPTQRAALRADKTAFHLAETASATLLVRNSNDFGTTPQIRLQPPEGDSVVIKAIPAGDDLHQFRADFGTLPEGHYIARLEGARPDEIAAATAFDVVTNLRERLDVAARADLMRLLSDGSGGTVIAGTDPAELLQQFNQQLAATQPKRLQQSIAWDRWWVLSGILLLWATTWAVRRRGGLI